MALILFSVCAIPWCPLIEASRYLYDTYSIWRFWSTVYFLASSSSFSPFSAPPPGASFVCFFVSPLLYPWRNDEISYRSFAHGAYDDTLARRWLSRTRIPPGEITTSEQPFWKSFPGFPLRAIAGERNDRLSLYSLRFCWMAILRGFCFSE